MTNKFDLIIKGGTIVAQDRTFIGDLAVRGGLIVAIADSITGETVRTIDATGQLVLPGGVDSHCHIEQLSGAGLMNADTFETATRSAAFGGTTTVISFAAQHPGMALDKVVADYSALAKKGALIDYAFHTIVADITGDNLTQHLPALIKVGHRSIKIFTTYDKVRLDDADILKVLACAKQHGAMVCFHAENDALIRHATAALIAEGKTAPKYHALSHPREAEIEALTRICTFSEFTGQPVMLFHISTKEGVEIVKNAQLRGAKVFAETCPHYLLMNEDILDQPGIEGAKYMCSPPQRRSEDSEALWQGLSDNILSIVSSDHAPYRMDESGKLAYGDRPPFNKIANGMPGLETRLPVMFDAMVSSGKFTIEQFAHVTATNPSKLFGLNQKGSLAEGMDADITIWDPQITHTYGDDDLHDNVGYNPFTGHAVRGWTVTTISRGEVIVKEDELLGKAGRGQRQIMDYSESMQP